MPQNSSPSISEKKTPRCAQGYSLGGHPVEWVSHTKDLGFAVSRDVEWTKHMEEITSKSNKTLGLRRRICRDLNDIKIRKLLFIHT